MAKSFQYLSNVSDENRFEVKSRLSNKGKRRHIQALLSSLTFALTLVGTVGLAQAQDIDLISDLSDTGFDPIPAGGTVTYTLSVSNNGPDAAAATTVNISIPSGAEFTGVSGGIGPCTPSPTPGAPIVGPSTLICDIVGLADQNSVSADVDVRVPGGVSTSLTAAVSIPAGHNDATTGNDTAVETTTITSGADLSLSVTAPSNVASGDTFNFSIDVENLGPDDLSSGTIIFPAPTGLTGISAPVGCTLSLGMYSCPITSPLTVGATENLNFSAQVSAGGGSTVTLLGSTGTASPDDGVSANNTGTTDITIDNGSDVGISKSRAPGGVVLVGDTVDFTLAASYTGGSPNGLVVTDTIPANYSITSVTPTAGWNCNIAGQTVTCTRASGGSAGASQSLGNIAIETTAITAGNVSNTATITSAGPNDPNPGNNSDADGGVTIEDPVVDLAAVKTGPDPALVVVGNSYDYSIQTQNIGNAAFFGTVVMTDTIPAGLSYTGLASGANGWSCLPAASVGAPLAGPVNVVCQRDYTSGAPLEANQSTPSVTLGTVATGAGTIVNSMTVTTVNPNIAEVDDLSNNTTTYTVESSSGPNSADIQMIKTVSSATVGADQQQVFTLEIVNNDTTVSNNINISDNLFSHSNGNLISVVPSAGANATGLSCSSGLSPNLVCTITTLAQCTATVNCPLITITTTPGDNAGNRTNTASAISVSTPDPDLTNNSDSASYNVLASADVTTTKTVSASSIAAGQNVTYVLTAQNGNNGLSAAENVTLTDSFPSGMVFVSASPSAGTCATQPTVGSVTTGAGNELICNLGTISNGSQHTVTVILRPTTGTRNTTLTNNVVISTTTPETDGSNNNASVGVAVTNPVLDLLINKIDDVDPVSVTEDTSYTLTVTNNGPSHAENVVVSDAMPAGNLSFQSLTAPGDANCGALPAVGTQGAALSCSFPMLQAGASRQITIVAQGVAKGLATNNATVTSDETALGFDTNTTNNTVDENTTVRTRVDLEVVSKVPSAPSVNLRDDFNFIITVRNNVGLGLGEADDVVVSDTLPANMELTGAPSVTSGLSFVTTSTCTGAVGGTSFSCSLGTFDNGGVIEITVPVQLTAVSGPSQSITNTASVTTSSLDIDPSNNSNFGGVNVNSSTIAGTLFRDFANDGALDGTDTGISGVTMTLTGTSFDGATVTRTVTTANDGTYNFANLPSSDATGYTVVRSTPSEAHLTDGIDTAGTIGGTLVPPTGISAIVAAANTDYTDYLFAMVPQARIGIAKRVSSGPTANPDGSYNVDFTMVVENQSLETLNNIQVTDILTGTAPLFGTHAILANPATDALAAGQYTVLAPSSGTCGANAGFNGASDQVLVNGAPLASGATCNAVISLRVRPTVPMPAVLPSGGRYENQAAVTGVGALSAQTPSDTSDNGTNPDPDGDGVANEAGENDPTPVTPVFNPDIALVKTANTSAVSNPPALGDVITYNFAITNTGDVNLSNVTLTDNLVGLVINGGTLTNIPLLTPGATDTTTFTATYAITQDDIDAGEVVNTATTTGTDPYNDTVNDISGTTTANDTPLTTPISQVSSITLVKTQNLSNITTPAVVGQVINYAFSVINTGNTRLTNVGLTENLAGAVVSGGPINMEPGDVDSSTFTATYAITQADIDAGVVLNTAVATGSSPSGTNDVTDTSGTAANNDTPVSGPIGQNAAIMLVKTGDDTAFLTATALVGDVIPYTFTITNTGNVSLTNVTLTDILVDAVVTGGPIASLAPGGVDTTTFTATYALKAADILAGEVNNTATATGNYSDGSGTPQTVTDDDSDVAIVAPIEAVSEVFPPFTTDGGTTTSMLASDTVINLPATLTPANVVITVLNSASELTLSPATGLITLAPGHPAGEYQVEYQICSVAFTSVCDIATETVTQAARPAIETVKSQVLADNGDGIDGVGDTVTYTITVENIGNVPLSNLVLVDTFTTLTTGQPLTLDTGPSFVSADASSPEGVLLIGETATYTADFTLTISAVSGGGLDNTVTATADPVFGPTVPGTPTPVSDVSDDDNDLDGNTTDDPTLLPIAASLAPTGLTVEKTTPRGVVERGSVVPYTIIVRNDNPVVSGTLNIIDALPAGFLYVDGSATLDGASTTVTVEGRIITWPSVPIPPLTTVTLTLSARVTTGADVGDHINTATIRNPTDDGLLAPPGTATVRILPEPVFDCGDVIGKVYDDANRDGYQNEGEAGIPAARVVGVDGTVITTDEFGRFHVPCAMLPADRGSNFILKLDTRALPSGYRVTTENPRVIRLTPGKLSELNFGVALTRLVRVDLNANAFVESDGDYAMTQQIVDGISVLLPQISDEAIQLRLAFHVAYDAPASVVSEGRKMMRVVHRYIEREWRNYGRVKLTIEQTIVRQEP